MAREQGAQPGAKADTVYLSEDPSPEVDLSQWQTDATASGAGAYESPSARTALSTVTMFARWTATAAEVGVVLIIHGNTAQTGFGWALSTGGAGEICARVNTGTVVWTLPNPTAAKDYGISWSMRPNPDTTGVADAMISEYVVWNYTDAQLEASGQTLHIAALMDPLHTLGLGGWWDGATLTNAPINAPVSYRVSRAPHTNIEVSEDWIGPRPVYSGAADGPTEPPGPIPSGSGMGDEGSWAGRHPWAYTAAHTRQTARRSWAPVVNETMTGAAANSTTVENWLANAPGDPDYSMSVQHLRWVPIPPEATHAYARVHISTAGAGDHAVRLYAMNRPPGMSTINGQPAPTLEAVFVSGSLVTAGAEDGWAIEGYVAIPRFTAELAGWRGTVHVCLAWETAGPDFEFNAWHLVPTQRFTPGGIDLG